MKLAWKVAVAVLTLLAVVSGVSKMLLIEQDVEFFGKYGFSNPVLIVFGALQMVGGILIPFSKTRAVGASVVGVTFLVSLVMLLMDGNIPVSIVTAVATLLLGILAVRSRRADPREA